MYEARAVGVTIGGRDILRGVDLALPAGRLVALIGPNGAGKSTLLKAMAGERQPSAGTVTLHGADVGTLDARALAGLRAVLVQSPSLSSPFPVDAIVRLGIPATIREAAALRLVERALAAVGMSQHATRPITRLSGGEQQRVHAARALVQLWAQPDDGRARYLLLDEPTTHLDPAHQILLLKLARDHVRSGGGALAILHDINLAAAIADEIVAMESGQIVARGTPHEVLTEPLLSRLYGVSFEVIESGGRRWATPRTDFAA